MNGADNCFVNFISKNGFITYLDTNTTINLFTKVANYALIEYKCDDGYTLKGNKRNVCVNGQWQTAVPECKRLCNPDDLISVTFVANCFHNENSVSCYQYVEPGTLARVNCNRGYKSASDSQQILSCGIDGKWFPQPLPCVQTCGETGPQGAPQIVGGRITDITKVPWHVAVYQRIKDKFQQICGGTIVNAKVIITAIHCFWDRSVDKPFDISEFRVIAGKFNRDFDSKEDLKVQPFSIERLYYSDSYKDAKALFEYDIALAILDSYLEFNIHISPICIDYDESPDETLAAGSLGQVAGWGLESTNGLPSPYLKIITLPIISKEECILNSPEGFAELITSDKFCAGHLSGQSVCQGDSGGGLVLEKDVNEKKRYFLKGIVSTGSNKDGSCDSNHYSTFTNVANFTKFIKLYEEPHRPGLSTSRYRGAGEHYSQLISLKCKILDVPVNGFLVQVNGTGDFLLVGEYVENFDEVEYACYGNYSLVGTTRNVCIKGNWINEVPRCISTISITNASVKFVEIERSKLINSINNT